MAKTAQKAKGGQKDASSKDYVKVIKTMKSPKTGAYVFVEKVVHKDRVKDFLAEK